MVTLHNLRFERMSRAFDFRIDRESPVGNPVQLINEGRRDLVCDAYERIFKANVVVGADADAVAYVNKMLEAYKEYGMVRLFCWCVPLRCHGETIKKYLEWQISLRKV